MASAVMSLILIAALLFALGRFLRALARTAIGLVAAVFWAALAFGVLVLLLAILVLRL